MEALLPAPMTLDERACFPTASAFRPTLEFSAYSARRKKDRGEERVEKQAERRLERLVEERRERLAERQAERRAEERAEKLAEQRAGRARRRNA